MSDFIIPAIFLIIFALAAIKNIPSYNVFVEGAKSAVDLALGVFPYLAAIMTAVALFRVSGAAAFLSGRLAPAFTFLGMPPELSELALLRPFSGSGSIALLNDIYNTYGADSYIGRCASVVTGGSETVFYVAAVYFAKTKVRRLGYAIPVALFACLIGAVVACQLCKVI